MISITGNINMDPLKRFFPENEAFFPDYNQYRFEILNPQSLTRGENIKYLFLFLSADQLFMPGMQSAKERSRINAIWEEHIELISFFLQNEPQKVLIMPNFTFYPNYIGTDLDYNSHYSLFDFENKINQDLLKLSRKYANLVIMNWDRIIKKRGFDSMINHQAWFLGRIPFFLEVYDLMGKEIVELIELEKRPPKKVLVLDLDNTLWGGIVGEAGPLGVELSEDGVGKAYRDFQRVIKELKAMGVLLCISSKNNESDAREVFETNQMMMLEWDDFIIKKINWQNKPESIQQIAAELNLGLDSFVFIDDNAFERTQVKDILPQVEIPDFPHDPTHLVHWLLQDVIYKFFRRSHITEEDFQKNDQYSSNLKRKEAEQEQGYHNFLNNLNMEINIYLDAVAFIHRFSQMTKKTNQFNLTTNRWSESEIEHFIKSQDYLVFSGDYVDKFGKEGVVILCIIKIEHDRAVITDFIMSCRILGRSVEYHFLKTIFERLENLSICEVEGLYKPTNKNMPVKDLYRTIGFEEHQTNRFILSLDKAIQNLNNFQLYGQINFAENSTEIQNYLEF